MRYAWHPAHETVVAVQYREMRRGERVAICRMPDDSCAVVPEWMLNAAICAPMRVGHPHVSAAALTELRTFLNKLGFDPGSDTKGEEPTHGHSPSPTSLDFRNSNHATADRLAASSGADDPGGPAPYGGERSTRTTEQGVDR
jgi:hypothetical protein